MTTIYVPTFYYPEHDPDETISFNVIIEDGDEEQVWSPELQDAFTAGLVSAEDADNIALGSLSSFPGTSLPWRSAALRIA